MALYSQFHQIYSQLKLINCISYTIYVKIFIAFSFSSNLLHMLLGGKWQTILKVTKKNSKIYKLTATLKSFFQFFSLLADRP